MWLMIAAVNIQDHDGISKKIITQASALSSAESHSYLACLYEGKPSILKVDCNAKYTVYKCTGISSENKNDSIRYITDCIKLTEFVMNARDELDIDFCYVRHMMPSFMLVRMLCFYKQRNIKIVYEIPTYPYFAEQINEANSKIKTGIRLTLEALFWPIIYQKIDVLTVIRCRSKSWHLRKMMDIRNGCSTAEIVQRGVRKNRNTFNFIGVGTIFKYHGYDRLIDAIVNYNSNHERKIKFYIVGESDEIENLKNSQLCLGNDAFIFTGKKFGAELEELYAIADLAVGTLSLNLRKADIDTALKNIEYIAKDLPIVTSGKIFDIPETSRLYINVGCNKNIDPEELIKFSNDYYQNDNYELRKRIISRFSWNEIMKEVKIRVES